MARDYEFDAYEYGGAELPPPIKFGGEEYNTPLITGYGSRMAIMRPGQEAVNEWGSPVSQEYVKDIEDTFSLTDEEVSRKIASQRPPSRPSDNELSYFDEEKKFLATVTKDLLDPKKAYEQAKTAYFENWNPADKAVQDPKNKMKIKQDADNIGRQAAKLQDEQNRQEINYARQAFKIGFTQREEERKNARELAEKKAEAANKTATDDQRIERMLGSKLGRKPTDEEFITEKQRLKSLEKEEGLDIPLLSEAVANGQDAPISIRGSRGAIIAQKVKTTVMRDYPKFDFNMADANYKWKQSATNQRTINFVGGALPRLGALDDQLKKMPNVEINMINRVMATLSKEFGKGEYTDFESNRNAIVQEINTALSGTSQGSDMRIIIELENLKSSRSPRQITGAIENLRMALEARLDVDLSPLYPIDVVRGEKTIDQYKKELYKKYRGDYSPHFGQEGAAASGPEVGSVSKGYRFKGGNPADKNSWEKI